LHGHHHPKKRFPHTWISYSPGRSRRKKKRIIKEEQRRRKEKKCNLEEKGRKKHTEE